MKMILICLVCVCTLISCKSQQVNTSYSQIELNSRTRGFSDVITISQSNVSRNSSQPGTSSGSDRSLSDAEKAKLQDLVNDLPLDRLEMLDPPSNDHASDRAMITTLSITSIDGSLLETPMFDKGNPPQEIKSLVEFMEGLVVE